MQNRARAKKQQALENGVIERVVKPGDQGQGSQVRISERVKHQRRAEPNQDDADVLDAMVGQQALQIVFHQRIEDAYQRRDDTGREHHSSRPQRRDIEEIEQHAREPVDPRLDHDA